MKRLSVITVASVLAIAAATAFAAPPRAVAAAPSSQITPEQRALLQEKIALVTTIMRNAGADRQSAQTSAERQRWMMESLYALPMSELRALGQPGGYEATAAAIARANMKSSKDGLAKFGQANSELVYYPITPCRFIDTRNVGGKIVVSRSYDLDQNGGAYGGSGTCNPSAVVGGGGDANNMAGIVLNVAIFDTTQIPGFMGVRPFGSSNTTSFLNWYEAGPFVQVSNAGVVQTDQSLATDEIEFFGTSTHIIVDVFGVFAAPVASPLDCVQGTLIAQTVSGAFSINAGTCPLNFRMVSNSCQALGNDPGGVRLSQHGVIDATTASCEGTYSGGSDAQVTNTPWCCRIPGR
jgi:hypothetical protein